MVVQETPMLDRCLGVSPRVNASFTNFTALAKPTVSLDELQNGKEGKEDAVHRNENDLFGSSKSDASQKMVAMPSNIITFWHSYYQITDVRD